MSAYYQAAFETFLAANHNDIIAALTSGTASPGFDLKPEQRLAWDEQLQVLRSAFNQLVEKHPPSRKWGLALEYQIPGRFKRLDAVLLDGHGIMAVEFKVGAKKFNSADKWQLKEYCWNLRDFHKVSHGVPIAPLLVATKATPPVSIDLSGFEDKFGMILPMIQTNESLLAEGILKAHEKLASLNCYAVKLEDWCNSQASPTQSIIKEAQSLYGQNDVREINHSYSDNTSVALDSLIEIVRKSKQEKLRSICFVTGVPGAGKTLVGLHAAYSPIMKKVAGEALCFASGNPALIEVIREALTLNRAKDSRKVKEVRHEVSSLVKNVHDFAIFNLKDPASHPPSEHVVVFDEAQRVWSAEKMAEGLDKRVHRRQITKDQSHVILQQGQSEPELLLRVMEKCPRWCVIIALVGGGQEIYDGEAGLAEWGNALAKSKTKWTTWVATEALNGDASLAGQTLFHSAESKDVDVKIQISLHLKVAKRSHRAERYAEWVNYVVNGRSTEASKMIAEMSEFPIFLTRNLSDAKHILRLYASEGDRFGLLASSGAERLRAVGIELKQQFRKAVKYADWYLKPPSDIRASNKLEIAATEFECQGLELDWTCVCWGGDFIRSSKTKDWEPRSLRLHPARNPNWKPLDLDLARDYTRNKYRVLLTRARSGLVIYVPEGEDIDTTFHRSDFDSVASYLIECGLTLFNRNQS